MSIAGLAFTNCNIYRVVTSQDVYGANYENGYSLIYSNIQIRIMYLSGQETFRNGKEQVNPIVRIYIPMQLDLEETDLIIDSYNSEKYDILNIYDMDYRRHMQVDARLIDEIITIIPLASSSSSSMDSSSSSSSYSTSSSSDSSQSL